MAPGNYLNSVVALDLQTGAVKWATGMQQWDTWTRACFTQPGSPNCPVPNSPDWDFGGGVNVFTVQSPGGPPRDIVGAGQKSGIYWALDPDTGKVLWGTQVGPGGTYGGIQFGTAVDDGRIFVAISNRELKPYTLKSGQRAAAGSWSALDAATGQILWQTPDPAQYPLDAQERPANPHAFDSGGMAVANGVVYAGSMDLEGHMYALDAATGAIRWRYASGGSVNSGPAVVNGVVYWGSGYGRRGLGSPNNALYAFSLPEPGQGPPPGRPPRQKKEPPRDPVGY